MNRKKIAKIISECCKAIETPECQQIVCRIAVEAHALIKEVIRQTGKKKPVGKKPVGKKNDKTGIDEEFIEFWSQVPHKVGGKKAAARAYEKARKNATKGEIFGGIENFRRYEEQREKKYPGSYSPLLPSRWLNEGRWEDERVMDEQACQTKRRNQISNQDWGQKLIES